MKDIPAYRDYSFMQESKNFGKNVYFDEDFAIKIIKANLKHMKKDWRTFVCGYIRWRPDDVNTKLSSSDFPKKLSIHYKNGAAIMNLFWDQWEMILTG